jgi:hypothetical protein
MEVLALKFEGTDLSGPCVSRKLSTNGNSTKSNVHLVSDCEALKTSCSTCPYGVVANYLKQVEDLVSCLFELLKCSQFKVEHLQCEKMKAGENLIGHRFAMVDQNVRISIESKLQGMMPKVLHLKKRYICIHSNFIFLSILF